MVVGLDAFGLLAFAKASNVALLSACATLGPVTCRCVSSDIAQGKDAGGRWLCTFLANSSNAAMAVWLCTAATAFWQCNYLATSSLANSFNAAMSSLCSWFGRKTTDSITEGLWL